MKNNHSVEVFYIKKYVRDFKNLKKGRERTCGKHLDVKKRLQPCISCGSFSLVEIFTCWFTMNWFNL